jgi:cysteine desulfurase
MTREGAYLDAVTSPRVDQRVSAEMAAFMGGDPSSPSALHDWAVLPAEVVERSRHEVAALVGAEEPDSIIFVSSATEARNLAVMGLFRANDALGNGIVSSAIEHAAVRSATWSLERTGAVIEEVGVDGDGRIDPSAIGAAVGANTALVTVHHGHEDLGTVQDVAAIVTAARSARPEARVHVDAGASAGLAPIDVDDIGCDALSIGGPPLGAPPWSGALYVRPGARLQPLLVGGTQELGKRAGPECLPAIAAIGAAARIAREEGAARRQALTELGERLLNGVLAVRDVLLSGPAHGRLPGNIHVAARGLDGETLAASLAARGVAVAPGSACTQDAGKESPALVAIGRSSEWTRSSVLVSLDSSATTDEVDRAVAAFSDEVARLRSFAPDTARDR